MKNKKEFVRIIEGVKITVTVEKTKQKSCDLLNGIETKKAINYDIGWVLRFLFGLEYTYSQEMWDLVIERRRLFSKKLDLEKIGKELTKEEGNRLMEITILQRSFHDDSTSDPLFYDFISEVDKNGGLESYRKKPILTKEEKEKRLKEAKELLKKLRLKRGLDVNES